VLAVLVLSSIRPPFGSTVFDSILRPSLTTALLLRLYRLTDMFCSLLHFTIQLFDYRSTPLLIL
jgi:hypothetical protein